jgi:hypothetical protein
MEANIFEKHKYQEIFQRLNFTHCDCQGLEKIIILFMWDIERQQIVLGKVI